MRSCLLVLAAAAVLAGCESVPETTTVAGEARERCETVLTGSRIPQCNRGDVKVITRDEVERSGYPHRGTDPPDSAPRGR